MVRPAYAGQAGNKSLLSYDSGRGVPGYTGFIPQSSCVPVDAKGPFQAAGERARPLDPLSVTPSCKTLFFELLT